ncbi:MAG: aspartate/glutamate racemase family protein [Candidatus Aminicenantaceae bacterium]
MKHGTKIIFILVLVTEIFFSCAKKKTSLSENESLENFFKKSEVTIAVTDSGLGGLSVMADAVKRMRESKIFSKVNFIFFNALFSNEGGYNSLKSRTEKIHVFNSALRSLKKNFHPDLILIGCNTLSTLYNDTAFSTETAIPVAGIVDPGVELIAHHLKASPDARVIIFATQTTVSEDTHRKNLMKKGFSSERIILQACPELVNYIERGYESEETEMLILAYVDEALQKIPSAHPLLYVSLNCTHYGYSLKLWEEAFKTYGVEPLAFLNPNSKMTDFLFPSQKLNRFISTEISTLVVSMVEISKDKIDSIGLWLKTTSPQTADALAHYDLRPALFEWEKYVVSER